MERIAVKLVNPHNSFKDDDGNKFVPHETRIVDHSDRIKESIKIRMLERVREEDPEPKKNKKPDPVAEAPKATEETK